MLKFFGKKKEAPATITLADHEAALALMAKANVDLETERRAMEKLAAHYKSKLNAARIEAAANADDAAKYRRSKANLKQFRTA